MDHLVPSDVEVALRMQLEEELAQLDASVKRDPPAIDRAEANITFFDTVIVTLQNGTFDRIVKLRTPDERITAKQEYAAWKTPQLEIYDAAKAKLRDIKNSDAVVKSSAADEQKAVALKNSLRGRINQQAQLIRDRIATLKAEIEGHSASENLQRSLYVSLVSKVDTVKQWIRPMLVSMHDKLIEADALNHEAVNAALGQLLGELDPQVDELTSLLHSLKFETSVFNPGASSTPNSSFVAATSQPSSLQHSRQNYDYGKGSLPKFEGNPIKYPKWKGEMTKSVLVGKEDEYALRLMSELSPEKDLDAQFDTQAEGWKHLDDLYANPTLVSERILNQFTDTKGLQGSTVQMKLVSLSKMMRKLFLTLRVVNEESQLVDNMPMINRAIKLMPDVYKEEFATKIEEAEATAPDGRLKAKAKYDLFSEWLEKKEKTLNIYLNETLQKKTGRDSTDPEPKETRKEKQARERQEKIIHYVENQMKQPKDSGKKGNSARGSTRDGEVKIPASQKAEISKAWKEIKACPCCGRSDHAF